MHNTNTRRGFTQPVVQTRRSMSFTSPLAGEVVQRTDEGVFTRQPSLSPLTTVLTHSSSPAKGEEKYPRGFTLIELLVVVLIIGILTAVAVPQYQVAVKKAQLARLIPLVKSIATAEEVYHLANGTYTPNLKALDIEVPETNCTYTQTSIWGRYTCGDTTIGVYDGPVNAQAGDDTIRYVYYFTDDNSALKRAKKGEIVCFSEGEIARKACKTLGPGEEKEYIGSSWDYTYKLQ